MANENQQGQANPQGGQNKTMPQKDQFMGTQENGENDLHDHQQGGRKNENDQAPRQNQPEESPGEKDEAAAKPATN